MHRRFSPTRADRAPPWHVWVKAERFSVGESADPLPPFPSSGPLRDVCNDGSFPESTVALAWASLEQVLEFAKVPAPLWNAVEEVVGDFNNLTPTVALLDSASMTDSVTMPATEPGGSSSGASYAQTGVFFVEVPAALLPCAGSALGVLNSRSKGLPVP